MITFNLSRQYRLIVIAVLILSKSCYANSFSSGDQQVRLLELFSSQGCSSCPPAQQWLNQLTHSPALWTRVVPIVFHVDYWDYLGWKDPYSSPYFSNRQRSYKKMGATRSVYTPGFFLQGKEWRGFFGSQKLLLPETPARVLSANVAEGRLKAFFDRGIRQTSGELTLNVAVLGMGLSTQINAGENKRRTLMENFVVLSYKTYDSPTGEWDVVIEKPTATTDLAMAIWVTNKGELSPLQATGGEIHL